MTKIKENTTPKKHDNMLTMQTDNQIFIFEIYFNNNSKETFQDKLLKAILSDGLHE